LEKRRKGEKDGRSLLELKEARRGGPCESKIVVNTGERLGVQNLVLNSRWDKNPLESLCDRARKKKKGAERKKGKEGRLKDQRKAAKKEEQKEL